MRLSSNVALLGVLTWVGVLARPALAQEDESGQARVHLRRAAAATDLGNYREAAKEYEAAYIETSDASLLATVGQAWLLAGDQQKALAAFRSCIRLTPDAAQRATCEAKGVEIAQQHNRPPARPSAVVDVPPPLVMAPPSAPAPYAVPSTAPMGFGSAGRCPTAEPSRWPLWVALGAVVVAGAVVGVAYARQDNELAMPITTFGTKEF